MMTVILITLVFVFWAYVTRAHSAAQEPVKKSAPNAGQASAGEYGERKVANVLEGLQDHIYGRICTGNIKYGNENFECDFLVGIKGYGLVLLEVKYYAGEVHCSSKTQWPQLKEGQPVIFQRNACLQVLRTRALVSKLLRENNLLHGDVIPAVVFSHSHARIMVELNPMPTQCDVIHINELARWLKKFARQNYASDLEEKRFEHIRALLKRYEVAYDAA